VRNSIQEGREGEEKSNEGEGEGGQGKRREVIRKNSDRERQPARHIALQHTTPHGNTRLMTVGSKESKEVTLQHTATHCNALQHAATHCNALQHAATRWGAL